MLGTKSCPQLQQLPTLGPSEEVNVLDSAEASSSSLPCGLELAAGQPWVSLLLCEGVNLCIANLCHFLPVLIFSTSTVQIWYVFLQKERKGKEKENKNYPEII